MIRVFFSILFMFVSYYCTIVKPFENLSHPRPCRFPFLFFLVYKLLLNEVLEKEPLCDLKEKEREGRGEEREREEEVYLRVQPSRLPIIINSQWRIAQAEQSTAAIPQS